MEIRPLVYTNPVEVTKTEVEGRSVFELSEKSALELLEKGYAIQSRSFTMALEKRLLTIDAIGRIWSEKLNEGKLDGLAEELSRKTGYSRKLMDMEFSLVPQVFNAENLQRSLETSFPARLRALGEVGRLPLRPAFNGVDRVQTIGLAVNNNIRKILLDDLATLGVYRVTQISDMYMRSPIEPYDGTFPASAFVHVIYSRRKIIV
ncbi:MAG: acyl-CoA reductase [Thermoproteota archaeon]